MSEYLGMMEFDNNLLERIKKVCEDTRAKDKTFKFQIKKSKFKKDKILIVSSESKNQSHRRLTWLVKKVLKEHNLIYWVKAKGGD